MGTISGREAAYMKAVALRHSARRVHELEEVIVWLDEAENRLARDCEERPTLKAGEIRFAAERLSLWVTYHLFAQFLNRPIPETVPNLGQVQIGIERLLTRLDECPAKRIIVRNVERNLLTNLFMVSLVRWGRLPEAVNTVNLRPALERFRHNLESTEEPGIEISFLVRAVYLTASWWITDDRKEKKRLRRELIALLNDEAIEQNAVFPYGRARFRFLRDLVDRVPGGV